LTSGVMDFSAIKAGLKRLEGPSPAEDALCGRDEIEAVAQALFHQGALQWDALGRPTNHRWGWTDLTTTARNWHRLQAEYIVSKGFRL